MEQDTHNSDSMRTITRMKLANRRGSRTIIYIDGEEWSEIDTEVVLRCRLERGKQLDDNTLAEIESEDAFVRCRRAAAILLNTRLRARQELRQRLRVKRFPAETVERTMEYFIEKEQLDDARFALMYARNQLRSRSVGPWKVTMKLRQFGVSNDDIETALDGLDSASDDEQRSRIRSFVDKHSRRKKSDDSATHRRRLQERIACAGFNRDLASPILDEMISDDPDEDDPASQNY